MDSAKTFREQVLDLLMADYERHHPPAPPVLFTRANGVVELHHVFPCTDPPDRVLVTPPPYSVQ